MKPKKESREEFLERKRKLSIELESRFEVFRGLERSRASERRARASENLVKLFKNQENLAVRPEELLARSLKERIVGSGKEFEIIVNYLKRYKVLEEKHGFLAITDKYAVPVKEKKRLSWMEGDY